MAYGMKLTTIGAAKLLAAATDETAITFSKIVWGDANGVAYEPTGEEANLVNQLQETDVLAVDLDPERPNVYRIDGELVSADNAFTLLEVGILDEDGDLIAIGNHPPHLVPGPSSGFTLNYHPSWFLVISPELAVAVTLAPPGEWATKEWVTTNFQPIGTYVKSVTGSAGVVVEGTATDRNARADEAWFDSRYRRKDDADPGVQGITAATGIQKTGTASVPVIGFDIPWGDARYRGKNEPFPLPAHIHPNATQSSDGFMSAADKTKLDGLNFGLGTSLFQKVAEVSVSSAIAQIDILNVTGAKLYLVRFNGLRVSAYSDPVTFKMQTGYNSTLYASSGDYSGFNPTYYAIPQSNALIGGSVSDQDCAGAIMLHDLNHTTRRTKIFSSSISDLVQDILDIDEARENGGKFSYVRAAATQENRLRFTPSNGANFTSGRVTVYAVAP